MYEKGHTCDAWEKTGFCAPKGRAKYLTDLEYLLYGVIGFLTKQKRCNEQYTHLMYEFQSR